MRVTAENLQKLDPKSDGAKRDWVAIYDECANVLYQVLTMEYVPEIKISRIQALDQLGVDRKKVMAETNTGSVGISNIYM
ncbi:protein ACTIVITY OF BC1 COMPLEX KINASE 8, chloroplastic-like [Rutidosis leptorrhynchoides]|uniref:protein ACTIVITY OF BC1 COMPLEX KINASE 8, chloroplastic-like n=1 Tax=Rutidosis leptorrhynchoides TaxID=125765 RepID=UPI003A9A4B86